MSHISDNALTELQDSIQDQAKSTRSLYLACPILLAILLGLGFAVPRGVVLYAFYAIAIVSALPTWDRRFVREMSLAAAVFVLLDAVLLQMPGTSSWDRLLNCGAGLLAIWAAMHLCLESISAYEARIREELRRAQALAQASELDGNVVMLCAWTKRIKEDGRWVPLEDYLTRHLHVRISHGVSDYVRERLVRKLSRRPQQDNPPASPPVAAQENKPSPEAPPIDAAPKPGSRAPRLARRPARNRPASQARRSAPGSGLNI
jgi:hypothetical protein